MNPADELARPREVRDPWNRGEPILLDGFTERHRFEPWFAALIVLALCWLLFQVVIAPIAIFVLLAATGVDLLALLEELQASGMGTLDRYTAHLLGANTIGLVFAFGIPALILGRMSSSRTLPFLRLRASDVGLVLLGLVAWAFLVPIVQLAAQLNAALPWPEGVHTWEEQMLEPITRFLEQPTALVPSLLMIAVAPAICEELLFRGYIQRQFERSMGVPWSIALSGILFGAYHLQPTKIVPLALLGVFFAYLTWRSGSLVPAMVAHFAQNATAIFLSRYASASPGSELADLDAMAVPWYLGIATVAFLCALVYLLNKRAGAVQQLETGTP